MKIVICRKYLNGAIGVQREMGEFPIWQVIPADYAGKPDYRNKYVTIDGVKYHIMWDKRGK